MPSYWNIYGAEEGIVMDSYLTKKEAYQREKGEDAWNRVFGPDSVPLESVAEDLVGREIAFDLSGKRRIVILSGAELPIIANFAPFYHRVYLEICPKCACAQQPEKLKPFLEAGFVIPIYTSSLARYPSALLDTVEPFPHIPVVYDHFFKSAKSLIHEDKYMDSHICTDCFAKGLRALEKRFRALKIENKFKTLIKRQILSGLSVRSNLHMEIIDRLHKDLELQGMAVLPRFLSVIHGVDLLDKHITYNAQNAVKSNQLDYLIETHNALFPTQQAGVITADVVRDASVSLGISYSPEIDVADYLQIVGPHIGECTRVLSETEPDQAAFMASTLDRVRDISSQVEKLASSRRKRLVTFVTWFTKGRRLLIPFIGGGLGWYGGGAACSAGGALAGTALQYLKELAGSPLKLPEETKSQLAAFLEPMKLKLLAKYYGASLEAVQIWHMREELKKLGKNKKDS